jgi:hypothetical protein
LELLSLQTHQHAELVLQDALQVAAVERAEAVLGRRSGFQPLLEAEQFRPGEAGAASGVGPLGEGLGTALIVAGDPLLDGADTTPRAWATAVAERPWRARMMAW